MTKPFSLEEVVLRIRALLRRGNDRAGRRPDRCCATPTSSWTRRRTRCAGPASSVDLSPTEFNLLRYLLANAGRVVSKAQILDRVWSYDFGGDGRIVESYVYYLRRKLDRLGPPMIHTVRGVGYALRLPRAGDQ